MRSSIKHLFRLGSLVVPSLAAWSIALGAPHRDGLTRALTEALLPLWLVVAAAFLLRLAWVLYERRNTPARLGETNGVLAQLDVLTSAGAALAWLSAFAIMGAVWIGWASLAAIGLLGTGVFHVAVLFAFFSLRHVNPAHRGAFERRFSPSAATEGDDVVEELVLTDVPIPVGFRLFTTSRVGPRWAVSRHVLDPADGGGEIALESEIGPAVRGTHHAEPVEVWLEDVFGLCRSMVARVAPATLTVLPRPVTIERVQPLLGQGVGERAARPTAAFPTEGAFRLREYADGDDVRRIHWVRSLAAGELIVRLPDELPPDQPRVRLVLDTFFPESFALTSRTPGPAAMLDAMVATWLGVGRALAAAGIQVTLVTAAPRDGSERADETVVVKRHRIVRQAPHGALVLGAEVGWQGQLPVSALLTDEATWVVSSHVLASLPADAPCRWIVVVPPGGTEPTWNVASGGRVPFPMGHSENRWSFRRRTIDAFAEERADHARAMRAMVTNLAPPPRGSVVAVPSAPGSIRLEALA